MNFVLEIINALSFIFIILAYCGIPVLAAIAVSMNATMNDFSYRKFITMALFLILITLLAIAGAIITY